MSIFAERLEQTELMALPISVLPNIEWECMDLDDFTDEFRNPKMIRRLKYACRDIKSKHIFSRLLRNLPHNYDVDQIIDMVNHLKEIGHEPVVIGATMFNNKRQFPREFIEANLDSIEMYHIENQGWIDPEFFEKHSGNMDRDNFWEQFGRVRTPEQIRYWYEYNNNQYVETMTYNNVFEQFTVQQLNEIGIPVPDYYNTVITAQRIMSGDPCHDGQRSYAIWLRKYRRVYNDPDGYPTWGHLMELCHKHPRMNNDGYVDWIRSRCLHNSEEVVRQARATLEIKPKSITEDTYQSYVQNTDDDIPTVIVPEFREEAESIPVAPPVPPSMNISGRVPNTGTMEATVRVRPTIMGAPIGSFSPEMIRVAEQHADEFNADMARLIQTHIDSINSIQTADRTQRPQVEGISTDYMINPSLMRINPLMWSTEGMNVRFLSEDEGTNESDSAEPDSPDEPE